MVVPATEDITPKGPQPASTVARRPKVTAGFPHLLTKDSPLGWQQTLEAQYHICQVVFSLSVIFQFNDVRLDLWKQGKNLWKDRTGRTLERRINGGGEGSGKGIDLYHEGSARLGNEGERGGGLHDGRRPDGEKDIGRLCRGEGAGLRLGRQGLAEPNDVRAKQASARTAGREDAQGDFPVLADRAVRLTAEPPDASVELDNPLTSRLLVEAVDVLGDEGERRREAFQRGQGIVGRVRGGLRDFLAPPIVPFPNEPCVAPEGFGGRELLRSGRIPPG